MSLFFDAHADTFSHLFENEESFLDGAGHFNLIKCSGFSPAAQFFATYGHTFDELYPFIERSLADNSERVALCCTAAAARQAAAQGKLAAFLSLEGGETVGCTLEGLEDAYLRGVRMVALTWNHDNALAGGVGGSHVQGISKLGLRFLQTARELGMIVDVSHLSDRSFWDVAEQMGSVPFVASHSNARSVCPHRRNLTDEQFSAIVRAGGIAGINLYASFLSVEEPATWEHVYAHIEHFLSLGGENHVGLGCDLDGCETLPEGMRGVHDLVDLYELLLKKNLSETLVRGIFYDNLMRVVETICDT